DPELAYIIAHAVLDFDPGLILYGLSGSPSIEQGHLLGLQTASEVFADRTYQPDGSLTPRSQADALIAAHEKCMGQVWDMLENGVVIATDGTAVPIKAETICLHGDGAHAVDFTRAIRAFLEKQGVAVKAS
ncbi:MAG: LamB/YcsF family protein, partial [Bacteroidetes bacterium]